ncbi:MAG: dinitrogenase iron-molybdenum cofactor biosynthesis protein [Chloroflexi bacterium]|nr:MAG: dinitrogenase iron-molybdenum cofactor biosynthesis protein [Chloroflexota bacterium]HDN79675.1 dinitrogenase iron-molybdenum cofactor biosynthesis protein [Chloroflexota bacterium]
MKIAVVTDDGVTISPHFGRALYYLVVEVDEQGNIVGKELREKLGHRHFAAQEHGGEDALGRHGYGPVAQDRHSRMAAVIADCEVLICGGMGWGAYEAMSSYGIKPIITDIVNIEEAVQAYLNGTIVDHTEWLH